MSKQRYLDTKFWDDSYIINKDPIEKLLFIYLLTNPLTNILGIYEISLRRIAFDTGIEQEMVLKILERFEKDNKVKYHQGYIALKNFTKHQKNNPSVNKGIETLISETPLELLQWVNIDIERFNIPKNIKQALTDCIQTPTYLNTNPNLNSNKDKDIRCKPTVSSSPTKNLINNSIQEPKKANNIEFDFELWSWHGIDDDIKDRWTKIFPHVEVELELVKMREFFKTHPKHERVIKEKFNNNYAIYIFDWLTRAEKWKLEDRGV